MFPAMISLQGAVGYKSLLNNFSYSAPVNIESPWTIRAAQKKEKKTITDHISFFGFFFSHGYVEDGDTEGAWGGEGALSLLKLKGEENRESSSIICK